MPTLFSRLRRAASPPAPPLVRRPGRVVRLDLEKMEIAGSVETGQALDGLGWVGK